METVIPELDVDGPSNVLTGQNVSYCALSGGKSVRALISIVYADGTIKQVYSDENGCIRLLVDTTGAVNVTASQLGYRPGTANVNMWGFAVAVAVVASSILLLLLLAALGYYVFYAPKRLIVSAGSLKTLVEQELIGDYKELYATERVYGGMPELPADKVKSVPLSQSELDAADRLAEEYGISVGDAETVVLGKKLNAKKIMIKDMPEELKARYRIFEL
jgi:hypothetical protein